MFTPPNISCVTCHDISCVMCHVPRRVTCHMSRVTCNFFFGLSGEVYRWRVCYQRGLPRLVLLKLVFCGTIYTCMVYEQQRIYLHQTKMFSRLVSIRLTECVQFASLCLRQPQLGLLGGLHHSQAGAWTHGHPGVDNLGRQPGYCTALHGTGLQCSTIHCIALHCTIL